MRRHRTVGLPLIALVLLVGGAAYTWLWATSGVRDRGVPCAEVVVRGAPAGTEDAVRAEVCATMDALTTAWGDGDAAAYAARFTDDATYTAFTGTAYRGREDIAEGHAALFAGLLEGTRLHTRYLAVDVVAPGVVRVLTRGDTHEGDAAPASLSKVQTHLLVERDGRWQVAAFHNTQRKPVMERLQFLLEPSSRPRGER